MLYTPTLPPLCPIPDPPQPWETLLPEPHPLSPHPTGYSASSDKRPRGHRHSANPRFHAMSPNRHTAIPRVRSDVSERSEPRPTDTGPAGRRGRNEVLVIRVILGPCHPGAEYGARSSEVVRDTGTPTKATRLSLSPAAQIPRNILPPTAYHPRPIPRF